MFCPKKHKEQSGIEKKDLPKLRHAGAEQAEASGRTDSAQDFIEKKNGLNRESGRSEQEKPFLSEQKNQAAGDGKQNAAAQKHTHERNDCQIDGDREHIPLIEGGKHKRKGDHAHAEAGTKPGAYAVLKAILQTVGGAFLISSDVSAVLPFQKPVLQIIHIGKGRNGGGSGEGRRKGKLKARIIDPGRIFHQQESGGDGQRRRGIIGTPQQTGGQGKREHDSGPHGRGGKAGHEEKGKQKESRNGTGGNFAGRNFSGRWPAAFSGRKFLPGGLKSVEEG